MRSPETGEAEAAETGQEWPMVDPLQSPDSAIYEIRLGGEIPPTMRKQFPAMTVHRSPIQTILYRDVTDVTELDVLLEGLQCMSLVPSELRASLLSNQSDLPTSIGQTEDD
jgi:hypothetical protein